MKQVTIEDMKKAIKENPITKKYLKKGIEEYGLTEEEALDDMISVWLSQDRDDLVNRVITKYEER